MNDLTLKPQPTLTTTAQALADRLVYTAPKLRVLGDMSSISGVASSKAFFFRSGDGGDGLGG